MAVNAVSPSGAAAATKSAPSAATGTAGQAGSSAQQDFDKLLASMRATSDAASVAKTGAGEDATEDRFLKLLVAQMKNQDPLNPLDNAQVTSQLAQINTVKGIDRMNASLQALVDRGGEGSATEAAAMVGRSVLVEGDALELPKEGVARGGFELAADATAVKLELLDERGAVVDARALGAARAGLNTFEWDGRADGEALDPGRYTMRVSASNGTERVGATPLAAAPVQAVVRGADGIVLQLGTHGTKPLDQVRAIL